MIPSMLVFGLALGRWWRAALIASAIVWPALLLLTGVFTLVPGLIGATVLGVANAAVGVLIHQGVLHAYRRLVAARRRAAEQAPGQG